jgi:hypothetical protein
LLLHRGLCHGRGPTSAQKRSGQSHLIESLDEEDIQGAASINKDSVELDILYDGADYERVPPWLQHKVQVVAVVKSNGDLRPSKVLQSGRFGRHNLLGSEFFLPPGLIRVRDTEDVIYLLVSFGEVTLGILGLFLLMGPLGRLENVIWETLGLVAVSGLVLSLGVKNANAIQETFKFAHLGPVLLMATRSFYRVDGTVCFSLLMVAIG